MMVDLKMNSFKRIFKISGILICINLLIYKICVITLNHGIVSYATKSDPPSMEVTQVNSLESTTSNPEEGNGTRPQDNIQEEILESSAKSNSSVKKVLLYTYMRGGSSFIGEIFRQNPQALYWFEHMDGFYTTEFALPAMVKPLNILYFVNGTKRTISSEECQAIAEYHQNIFSCNYGSVSMNLFADSHNHHSTYNPSRCGFSAKQTKPCQSYTSQLCGKVKHLPKRLAPNIELSERNECFKKLHHLKAANKSSVNITGEDSFVKYLNCYKEKRDIFMSKCSQLIDKCTQSEIHALKAIRLTMETVQASLERVPDMYFIFYIRDPRGIISSRLGHKALLTHEPLEEALLICHRMLNDYQQYEELQKLYPTRTMLLKYEEFAASPFKTAEKVYKFIDREVVPQQVMSWLKSATSSKEGNSSTFGHKRSNSTAVSQSWRGKLSVEFMKQMTDHCSSVLKLYQYDF